MRAIRLDSPPIPVFDEDLFYIPAARAYLDGLADPNFEHPPLGKLAIAAGTGLLGDSPWGWRFPEAWLGVLGIALTYHLGRGLWNCGAAGLLAAFLLAADFLWLSFSRQAMLDMPEAVLLLLALTLAWSYRRHGLTRTLVAAGFALGLATAAKWSAAWGILPVFLAISGRQVERHKAFGARALLASLGTLAAVSCSIAAGYAAPWLYHVAVLGYGPAELLSLHARMLSYQTQVGAAGGSPLELMLASARWLLNEPLVVTARDDRSVWLLVMSNPLVFWPGVIATAALIRPAWSAPSGREAFLLSAVLALYLPWFAIPRLKYFYYLLPALPLLAIALGGAISIARQPPPFREQRPGARRRLLLAGYLAGAAAACAGAYPSLTGIWTR